MEKSVVEYKKRRQERMNANRTVRMDAVDAYKARRANRLKARMDAGQGWVFGALKSKGIDTKDMELGEAFEKWNEINKGKSSNGEKKQESEKRSGDNSIEDRKSGGGYGVNSKSKAVNKNAKNKKSEPENDRRKQECDGNGYNGEPGEVKAGRGGRLAPKSDTSKRISTGDAIREMELYKETNGEKGLERNSLSDHMDESGNLTPERQKVHDEIVQNYFKDLVPYDGQATMIMSGGGPASGKSFVSDAAKDEFGSETVVVIDPDKIKAMLPGFADMAMEGEKAAGFYHEESSALAKRIYQYACENNINVVYDGTGDGSVNSVKKKLKQAQDAGYAVRGEYVTVNVGGDSGALARNRGRYEHSVRDWNNGVQNMDPPRLVGDNHVMDIHAKVSDIAPDVANLFDAWVLTDNNVPKGAKRPVIARCKKDGEIEVVKGMEQKVQDWLDKGTRGGKVVNGKIVFPDNDKK